MQSVETATTSFITLKSPNFLELLIKSVSWTTTKVCIFVFIAPFHKKYENWLHVMELGIVDCFAKNDQRKINRNPTHRGLTNDNLRILTFSFASH